MTRALRVSSCATLVTLFLSWPVFPAGACSCPVASVAQHMEAASTVFVGVATESREEAGGLVAAFRVERVYKGAPDDRVDVTTSRDGAACGVPFVGGRSYAVFARDEAGALTTDLCFGTTDDLSTLSGVAPIAGTTSPTPRAAPEVASVRESRTGPIVIAGLLATLLAGAAALAVRAARRPRPIA